MDNLTLGIIIILTLIICIYWNSNQYESIVFSDDMPKGSYSSGTHSCLFCNYDKDILSCQCPIDSLTGYPKTSINVKNCGPGTITNNNGTLECTNMATWTKARNALTKAHNAFSKWEGCLPGTYKHGTNTCATNKEYKDWWSGLE